MEIEEKSLIEEAEKRAIISSKKYSTKEILDLSEQKTNWFDARTTLPNRAIYEGEESHFSELKIINCGGQEDYNKNVIKFYGFLSDFYEKELKPEPDEDDWLDEDEV